MQVFSSLSEYFVDTPGMELLSHLVIVVLVGYGLAVLLVEFKRKWPIRRQHLRLKKLLGCIHRRAPKMLLCTVCTSFWTTLIAEIGLFALDSLTGWQVMHGLRLWLWPLSGFVTAGLTWTLMDVLRSIGFISDAQSVIASKPTK